MLLVARARIAAASLVATTTAVIACSDDTAPIDPTGAGGASSATSTSTSGTGVVSSSVASSSSSGMPLPDVFTVTGVVTDGERPVEGATVMQGGGEPLVVTGPDGAFTVELTKAIPGQPTIVAAKVGYRTAGMEFFELPEGPIELAMRIVSDVDNTGYVYGDPGNGDPAHDNSTKYCGHCHTTFVAQFAQSAHAKSAKDPLVQDLYAGTSAHAGPAACAQAGGEWRTGLMPGTASTPVAKCYVGAGVLPSLNPGCGAPGDLACDDPALVEANEPSAFGACADCHAPGIDGVLGGRSLHEAVGIAYEHGNHCDVCHHVSDIDLSKPPGTAGRLVVKRPIEKIVPEQPDSPLVQVMFGPLPDVPNSFMGGSWQPKFKTSLVCAGCHEQKQPALVPGDTLDPARWPEGLPTHSTYEEWLESSFGDATTPCQFCHMPEDDTGLVSTLDVTNERNASITFGFVRPPEDIRQHVFRGPLAGSPRLIDGAVQMFVAPSVTGGDLEIAVALQNVAAGHAVPTGEPMRSLVLLVQADACGTPMKPSGGMTLDDVAGALARGIAGGDVTEAGTTLTWAAGAAVAKPGQVVRAVRPTGQYDDYEGVGFFANPALTPEEKGLEIAEPVAQAVVTGAGAGTVTLDAPLGLVPGDVVYLGDPLGSAPSDGSASLALAGAPGWTFARVLVASDGSRNVPHFLAVDIASDNRLPPGGTATTVHAFAIPGGCSDAEVTATLLYRPVPVGLARERAWDAKDWVIASAKQTVALP